MARQGLITYDGLPLSGGGAHVLRTRGMANGWTEVERFLRTATDFQGPGETIIELLEGPGIPRPFVLSLTDRLGRDFPLVRSRRVGKDFVGRQWLAQPAIVATLIGELGTLEPFPNSRLQPLTVNITGKFNLIDPATRKPLPFQDPNNYLNQKTGLGQFLGTSQAFGRLSARSTLALFLSLPFETPGAEFQAYAAFLSHHAPFQFSQNGWKMWRLNTARSAYAGRKINALPEQTT